MIAFPRWERDLICFRACGSAAQESNHISGFRRVFMGSMACINAGDNAIVQVVFRYTLADMAKLVDLFLGEGGRILGQYFLIVCFIKHRTHLIAY